MLSERWTRWRNTLLASPRFQRFAAQFPLTRPIARRRAAALFDLVAGFTYSQTLHTCVALGWFARLAGGPLPLADLARAGALPIEGARRLARAAAALDLLELYDAADGARVTLGGAGAALAGNPGVAAMIAHHSLLYADLADPVALLRRGGGGALADFWRYAEGGDAAAVADYSALMAASQAPVAAELLAAYRFGRHRRLLDVGGGQGIFLAAVARAHPALTRGLFDLPAVCARVAEPGIALHPGSFLSDPLPQGYDLITLVRVLHDHDDDAALSLLRAVRAALPPRGRLLIGEPMADAPGARRVGAVYFGLYLLAMGSGRARTPDEIGALLRTAGFARSRVRRTAMPLITGMITADA